VCCTPQELQQHAVAGVLEQLQQWAAATAAPPAAQPLPKHQQQQQQAPAFPPPPVAGGLADPLPVVMLSVASSTNTAETYADVLLALRKAVSAARGLRNDRDSRGCACSAALSCAPL
jgi:hypothetical protein